MEKIKFVVHLTTFPPRYGSLSDVLHSWHQQSVPVKNVVVTVCTTDPRHKGMETLEPYTTTFPKTVFQTMDGRDYGPHLKILGALLYYESLQEKENVCIIIGDDDIAYDPGVVGSYLDMIKNDDSCAYTHFQTSQRVPPMNHVQGADTYVLPPKFLERTSLQEYQNYLDNILEECPDAFFQDDYVISFFLYRHRQIPVRTVLHPLRYRTVHFIEAMHRHPNVYKREGNTICYLKSILSK